jgi:UDP-glucose 4-epimerase
VAAKILIIGGTGFIGGYIVSQALVMGWEVTVLHYNSSVSHQLDSAKISYLIADISDLNQLKEKLSNNNHFDYVVNCGGYINHSSFFKGGKKLLEDHFCGVMNLVSVIDRKSLKSFVNIGSSDEYGAISAPQKESDKAVPISSYSLGKFATTAFLKMLYDTEKFPATTLRLFLIYGPGQNGQRFLPQVIHGCLSNQTFPVSEGMQKRDFLYISDLVTAVFMVLDNEKTRGEVFNIASGQAITIREMIELIRKKIGSGQPLYGEVPYRVKENMELYADISKARTILNWEPIVSINEGLTATINHYKTIS